MKKLILLTGLIAMTGCAVVKDHVFVNTETILGISVCQSAASGSPEARLGYARIEVALAPTNSDVLTEFQFQNAFSFTAGPSLYQRMAVGKDAVAQPSTALMFSKDSKGNIATNMPLLQNLLLKTK